MAWKLKAFTVSESNDRTIVSEWYDAQTEDVQQAFYTRMEFLVQLAIWDRPHVGRLRKDCKGLMEIRLTKNKVEYRPIGYMSGPQEFTFLAFATERDGKFDPLHICKTAFNRMATIKGNGRRVREIKF